MIYGKPSVGEMSLMLNVFQHKRKKGTDLFLLKAKINLSPFCFHKRWSDGDGKDI